MKIGICLPYTKPELDRERLFEWCRMSEDSGLTSISCGERMIGSGVEMTAALAAVAMVTEKVRIVPSLYVLPMHSAVWVAKNAATLDVLSNGRVDVVVGIGGRPQDYACMEREMSGMHPRMDKQVATMKRMWAGEAPDADLPVVGPAPVQPGGPPLFAGVMGPKATRRAAEWADGVYSWSGHGDPNEVAAQIDRATQSWDDAKRDESPRVLAGFWCSLVGDTPRLLRQYVYDYMSFAGDELASLMADMQTLSNADAVRRALDGYEELGVEECLVNPVSAEIGEIEELLKIVADR